LTDEFRKRKLRRIVTQSTKSKGRKEGECKETGIETELEK